MWGLAFWVSGSRRLGVKNIKVLVGIRDGEASKVI